MYDKIMLVDANNFVYQTYYGCGYSNNTYLTKEEIIEKTVESVLERIKWIEDYRKTNLDDNYDIYLVFDAPGGKDKRLEIYPEYKGGRSPMPEEIKKILNQLEETTDYKIIKENGLEADDVIAQITTQCDDREILIVSTDRDLEALVKSNVSIYRKGKIITEYALREELQTKANLMEFIQLRKALTGDGSDNIKGVKGIGKVKSLDILHTAEANLKTSSLYEGVLRQLSAEQRNEFKLAYKVIQFQM